jgi:hypothetical protein
MFPSSKYREVLTFIDQFTETSTLPAARYIRILLMNQYACWLITFEMYNSQITGGIENAVPLHIEIPRTVRRGSDLPFEAVLQEYLQFHCEYFL